MAAAVLFPGLLLPGSGQVPLTDAASAQRYYGKMHQLYRCSGPPRWSWWITNFEEDHPEVSVIDLCAALRLSEGYFVEATRYQEVAGYTGESDHAPVFTHQLDGRILLTETGRAFLAEAELLLGDNFIRPDSGWDGHRVRRTHHRS